jgi:RimJ/RimL family protein N-acetyltransferase
MPPFPDLAEPLRGERVELRYAAERDIPEILIAHQDDPDLHVRLGYDRPPSGAELGRRTEGEAAERDLGIGVRFSIVEPPADTCRGQVDVHRVDWDNLRAELGVWVAPQVRGRGLAAQALVLVGRWLCDQCGLARVELLTEPGNQAMVAAARAAGFVEEGLLRAYVRERGRRVDLTILSLLPGDLGPAR